MPSITRAEYERLKKIEGRHKENFEKLACAFIETDILKARLKTSEEARDQFFIAFQNQMQEAEKWKRYYDAVREALKVEEEVEIPNCFNLADIVEYIVKKQEEVNDKLDGYVKHTKVSYSRCE